MTLIGKLLGRNNPVPEPVLAGGVTALHRIADPDNMSAVSVVAIQNGFLVCRRLYNPNGPDTVTANYVATAEELGPTLVAVLAAQRITK